MEIAFKQLIPAHELRLLKEKASYTIVDPDASEEEGLEPIIVNLRPEHKPTGPPQYMTPTPMAGKKTPWNDIENQIAN